MSDYLWDGSGERDPEVERLERLLSSLRRHRPAPELPAPANRRAFGGTLPVVVAAASVALAVAGTWLAARSPAPAWEVTRLAPSAGGDAVAGVERLRVGHRACSGTNDSWPRYSNPTQPEPTRSRPEPLSSTCSV